MAGVRSAHLLARTHVVHELGRDVGVGVLEHLLEVVHDGLPPDPPRVEWLRRCNIVQNRARLGQRHRSWGRQNTRGTAANTETAADLVHFLVRAEERDRQALLAGPACPTDPVGVVLGSRATKEMSDPVLSTCMRHLFGCAAAAAGGKR